MEQQGRIVDRDWKKYTALHLVNSHPNFTPEEARKLLYHCVKSHCHPMNFRKEKIVRRWNKLERSGPDLKPAGPYKVEAEPWVSPPVTEWRELSEAQPALNEDFIQLHNSIHEESLGNLVQLSRT
jgi:hypothetical protein